LRFCGASKKHSRDLEPMKGGHGDDYYYQFVGHVRRYKGARAPQAWVRKPIQVDAALAGIVYPMMAGQPKRSG
jgi:hypothetical protein